jgi:hypothetical protein
MSTPQKKKPETRKNEKYPRVQVLAELEAERPVLEQIPEDELLRVVLSPDMATSRGLQLAEVATRDLSVFEEQFKKSPRKIIESMPRKSLAVTGAAVKIEDEDGRELEEPDYARATTLVNRQLNVIEVVCVGDADVEARIAEIRPGQGRRDIGTDAIATAALSRQTWDRIGPTGLVTRKEVEELETLGLSIIHWLDRKVESRRSRLLYARAFTSLARSYIEIREHARFAFRHDPDHWVEAYPSLFDQPKPSPRKKPEAGTASTPAEETVETAPADSPRPADDAAPTA